MRSWITGGRAIVLATAAAAVLAGICAVALGAVGGSAQTPPPAAGLRAVPGVQEVPVTEAAAFAVLRRPLLAGDAVPLGGALVERLGRGANVALARRADGGVGTPRWVIPAADGVCLTAELDGAFGGTCASLADAQAGREVMTMIGGPGRGSRETTVIALAPDDAVGASLVLPDGTMRPLRVASNTVEDTVMSEPAAIRWQLADGATRDAPVFAG